MNHGQNILSLLVVAGILLCPYTCMGIACAHTKADSDSATGCHCQKCKHDQGERSRPAEKPNDGHCCVCVCDGALAKASDDDSPGVVLLIANDSLTVASESLPATQVVNTAELPLRSLYKSGKSARIALRSLVI